MKMRFPVLVMAALAWTAVAGFYIMSVRRIDSELENLRSKIEGKEQSGTAGSQDPAADLADARSGGQANLNRRLKQLEQKIERLNAGPDRLADHARLPSGTNRIEALYSRLSDPTATDADRLRALGALRRNKALTDEVVSEAVTWLEGSSDPRTRREILKELDGGTNATLKATLVALAGKQGDQKVREEAVNDLRHFADDPQAENLLWQILRNDPDEKVRQKAEAALRKGPLTDTRAAEMRQRALDDQAPLTDRLTAMRALSHGQVDAPEVMASLANLAQNSQDPVERASLFRGFSGVDDPVFKAPLVYGLQDQNPVVRKEAADALTGFVTDPQVQQWLRYVAGNDGDPSVRREAYKALASLTPRPHHH